MCFQIRDRYGVSLLTKHRVEFSDLGAHRFHHSFNCPTATCACGVEDETNEHCLTRCPLFSHLRVSLINSLCDIVNPAVQHLPHDHLTNLFMFGSNVYNKVSNKLSVEETIPYNKKTKRFKVLEAYAQA